MPATSTFISAASSGMSGIGYSRISVVLGATLTAARTFSAKAVSSCLRGLLASRSGQAQFRGHGQADAGAMTDQETSERKSARQSRSTGDVRRDLGFRRSPEYVAALDRVRVWTRERFTLA